MLRPLAAAAILAVAAPAGAQTVAEVESAWRGWMGKANIASGGIAVLHKGKAPRVALME